MRMPTLPGTRTRTYARTGTHTDIILVAFPRQQRFAKAHQCYGARTLPVLSVILGYIYGYNVINYHFCTVLYQSPRVNDLLAVLRNIQSPSDDSNMLEQPRRCMYMVVQIWPGLFVCKQVTVCPGHIWTTLCNVTSSRVHETIVAVEKWYYVYLFVCVRAWAGLAQSVLRLITGVEFR
jgi:hypothetical protein